MQAPQQAQNPTIPILYDSSLDGGIDQVLAVQALFHLQATRRVRIASLSTGQFNLRTTAFLDAFARSYGGGGDYGPTRQLLPVGMSTHGVETEEVTPMIGIPLARTDAEGNPLYEHRISQINDTSDAVALIRNALSAYADGLPVVVVAGRLTNFLSFLALPEAVAWAERKARVLCVAGGRFDGGAPDPAVAADVAGYRKLLADWPTPIVMAGVELNDGLLFPGSSIEAIAGWSPDHPMIDSYRAFRPMPYDAPTQALAAVLHASSPDESLFDLSEPGTITVEDDGRTRFTPSPEGRHRYLIASPGRKPQILESYVRLVTEDGARYAPAQPGRGGGPGPGAQAPIPASSNVAGAPATSRIADRSGFSRLGGLGLLLASAVLVGCSMVASRQPGTPESAGSPNEFATAVRPILEESCAQCHGGLQPSAGLNVTGMTSPESLVHDRASWEKILRRLRAGEMPPAGMPKPDPEKLAGMIAYIENAFALADAATPPDPGRMIAHRLNRNEYSNTIRDLLGVSFAADRDFPADDTGLGFDNIGELLNLSPLLMERYMAAAERISEWAISTRIPERPLQIEYKTRDQRLRRIGRSIVEAEHQVEFSGEYVVRFELPGERPQVDGVDARPVTLALYMDGELLESKTIETKPSGLVYFNPYSEEEMRVFIPAGDHVFRAAFLDDDYVATLPDEDAFRDTRNKFISGIVFNGPFASATVQESRTRVLTCDPATGRACVESILAELATRAYRRPATARDVQSLAQFVDLATSNGQTPEEGIQLAIQAMLVSPNFLFRIERDPDPTDPLDVREVSQFELASRLSYFLWSSMPDDELLDLARAGTLRDPGVLHAQVDRMLADPKAQAFSENFAGQWLETRNLDVVRPDPDLFEDWDPELRDSMKQETVLFFQHILNENRPLGEFLTADYTFLNERLAEHYGIEGVTGSDFRLVNLSDSRRGGVLSHASVLTVTSYPTRTSPVIRGRYVLEAILGTPPPPPPDDIPALEASDDGTAKSMREQLARHRADPVCNSCHVRMDPLGFALENYDAIGRWRDAEGGIAIDPSGTLPDGRPFADGAEMRAMLATQLPQFSLALTEKMLTYALRRGLETYDTRTVEEIQRTVAADGYQFRTMVHEIVGSLPFQARRGEDTAGEFTLNGGSR